MVTRSPGQNSVVFASVILLIATPKLSQAYVDPGSGAMIWQVAAAAVIGSLFYVRKLLAWVRSHLELKSRRPYGYLFASVYALAASALVFGVFRNSQLPRFNDIYLIGIVLTAYFFTWDAAAYLLALAVLVSAWVLPPNGTLAVASAEDWYRIFSFTAVSVILMVLVGRLKFRGPGRAADHPEPSPLEARGMTAAD